tara:strand:+ start:111 stop:914 length:804 start_codon:yes stop_codon:yes gene_type:complete
MSKLYDCFTFFDENFLVNARFEILNDYVDYFVICESKFDHQGNEKKLNFKLINKKFANKIKYIVIEEQFPNPKNGWDCEKFQREKLSLGLKDAHNDDYIMYSDSDEIPNPEILKSISLNGKYGIFLQKMFVYKLNIYNSYETPWEGTRICKKKNLKSFTFLRKKILKNNLNKSFWKFYLEKKIDIFQNGGWHFNNLYSVDIISKKLRVSPHKEFSSNEYSSTDIIEKKISNLEDLYKRGHKYKKVEIDKSYPNFFLKNLNNLKNYIL